MILIQIQGTGPLDEPLGEDVLTANIGMQLLVVGTKVSLLGSGKTPQT
jgi:hypothetical protein